MVDQHSHPLGGCVFMLCFKHGYIKGTGFFCTSEQVVCIVRSRSLGRRFLLDLRGASKE